MIKRFMYAVVIFISVVLTVSYGISQGRSLGNLEEISAYSILYSLVEVLERVGIDVVGGRAEDVALGEGGRPRLTLLSNMTTDLNASGYNASDYDEFGKEFELGSISVLGAVPASGSPYPESADVFERQWQQASKDNRVFLAFARADVDAARSVSDALAQKGYVVFMYLNKQDAVPQYDARVVGTLFRESSIHLVIDTNSARNSRGIFLELQRERKDNLDVRRPVERNTASQGHKVIEERTEGAAKPRAEEER